MSKKIKNDETATASSRPPGEMRIAKAIARAGICSRRDAEKLITSGRITVNGKTIESPALNVTDQDKITFDGKPLPKKEPARLWRYHKPKDLITTTRDQEGRPTIFEKLPKDLPRTMSIGRLDINTEGLLLLTNDGELARHLELPSTGWLRRYKVRAAGTVSEEALKALENGLTIDGVHFGPIEANLIKAQGANCWFTIGLREGKNREVKRISEHLGLKVNRLIRLSYGPFMLGDLTKGAVEEVKPKILADQLGPALAARLGLNAKPQNSASRPPAKNKRRKPPASHFKKTRKKEGRAVNAAAPQTGRNTKGKNR